MARLAKLSSCLLVFSLASNLFIIPSYASIISNNDVASKDPVNKNSKNILAATAKSIRDREYRACRSRVHIGPNVHFGPNVFICGRRVS